MLYKGRPLPSMNHSTKGRWQAPPTAAGWRYGSGAKMKNVAFEKVCYGEKLLMMSLEGGALGCVPFSKGGDFNHCVTQCQGPQGEK